MNNAHFQNLIVAKLTNSYLFLTLPILEYSRWIEMIVTHSRIVIKTRIYVNCFNKLYMIYCISINGLLHVKIDLFSQLLPIPKNKIFCTPVFWIPLTMYKDSVDTRWVQKAQNSCLQLIFDNRPRQRVSHKLFEIGWLNMIQSHVLYSICFL